MKIIPVAGAELAVLDQGAGQPILFVHGFPLDHGMWQAQIAALRDQYRCLVVDLRGFGASSVTSGTVTMEQFADDLLAILDGLQIGEPITLCGLSMGGYVAFEFARKYPQRLRRLILCDTRSQADTAEAAQTRLKMARHVLEHGTETVATAMLPKLFAARTQTEQPSVVETARRAILAANPEGIAAAQRGMVERKDALHWLGSIVVPTLVVVGEEDAISPPAEMQQIAERIPGARFVRIPDAGHMVPMEAPAAFNAELQQFLADT